MILVLLLLIILFLIFKDSIFKIFTGNEVKLLDRGDVISEEYKIESGFKKSIYIDVLDTDVKIIFDKNSEKINIITKCLSEEFSYNVNAQNDSIKILRNNVQSYKKPGNSGKILVTLPKKCNLNEINILITNGDVSLSGINSQKLILKGDNGIFKIDSVLSDRIEIFKMHGDVSLSHADASSVKVNIKDGSGDFMDVYGEDIYVNVVNGDFIFANVCKDDYYIKSLKVKTLNGKQKVAVNANLITE